MFFQNTVKTSLDACKRPTVSYQMIRNYERGAILKSNKMDNSKDNSKDIKIDGSNICDDKYLNTGHGAIVSHCLEGQTCPSNDENAGNTASSKTSPTEMTDSNSFCKIQRCSFGPVVAESSNDIQMNAMSECASTKFDELKMNERENIVADTIPDQIGGATKSRMANKQSNQAACRRETTLNQTGKPTMTSNKSAINIRKPVVLHKRAMSTELPENKPRIVRKNIGNYSKKVKASSLIVNGECFNPLEKHIVVPLGSFFSCWGFFPCFQCSQSSFTHCSGFSPNHQIL